ncbi:Histone H3 (Lys4) methyltransferase complex, subunit CPS60/ASH2/BRE2 [Ceraceosorus bombacis]|uniref:Histone H3 (Lys4) methyltransferase complex, subunit CPS60/ASH2/BRE2 n=1 Tax=Ceraceosorus bombacis TaxID=401625 RepID=A0A0P1BKM2_9BASI|nr:Histone H3 (Lys4) methyltransferase complex, subunit CPS60/ASH2/BRE2 [Ceraceosorus bombacis]
MSAAQRAYIAKSAPHLLDEVTPETTSGRPSSATPQSGSASPAASVSPASSGRTSPASDADADGLPRESLAADTFPHERRASGTPGGTPSGLSGISAANNSSSHTVPPGFRGPVPKDGDAEEIIPHPPLLPTIGSATLFSPTNTPLNRNGWRYTPAGPASSLLPQTVYRTLEQEPAGVHWSWADRSAFTKMSADADVVSADKGFRSARANVPVRHGAWYVEVHILEPEVLVQGVGALGALPAPSRDGPHVRLGWARREAPLNAPAGFDGYSYGYRSATGERVWLSRPGAYGKPFGPGDVVGLWIRLPMPDQHNEDRPSHEKLGVETVIRRKRIPIRYRGQVYFEQLEYAPTKEMEALAEQSKKGLHRWNAPSSTDAQSGAAGTETAALSSHSTATASQPSSSQSAAGGGGKKRRNLAPRPEVSDEPKGRPLADLGPHSRIGFVLNGEPQGIAFDHLFDFRPLKRPTTMAQEAAANGKKKTSGAASGATKLGLADAEEGQAIITSSSSVASIMKSRENYADDGALGYFPFVSCYGGARAKIVADPDHWAFPPSIDLEAQLEIVRLGPFGSRVASVDPGAKGPSSGGPCSGSLPSWQGLSARYGEYMAEQWVLDQSDEVRAASKADGAKEAALRAELEEDAREKAARARKNKRKFPGVAGRDRHKKKNQYTSGNQGRSASALRRASSSRFDTASPSTTPAPLTAGHDQTPPLDQYNESQTPVDGEAEDAASGSESVSGPYIHEGGPGNE